MKKTWQYRGWRCSHTFREPRLIYPYSAQKGKKTIRARTLAGLEKRIAELEHSK